MKPSVLVAGVGNIFLGDDGFGSEAARRLAEVELPESVKVEDFGIRGVHLAYELLEGYDTLILVDAVPRGHEPGTVFVLEPDLSGSEERSLGIRAGESPLVDAHGMDPGTVFAMLKSLGGDVGRVLVVGCEPAEVEERMGLSEPVAAALDHAVRVVRELVEQGDARVDSGTADSAGKEG